MSRKEWHAYLAINAIRDKMARPENCLDVAMSFAHFNVQKYFLGYDSDEREICNIMRRCYDLAPLRA